MAQAELSAANEDLAQIRESVRALCAKFPGEYWRALDRERAYPTEFVAALTQAGFLAALIPEQYGGSGLSMTAAAAIMEEIQASGCNGAACHAQMYTMGTLLRHGSAAQKARWLPAIASGELRLQAFGVTEPTSGSDTLNLRTTAVREGDHYIINGQKIWTSRAEHSDLLLLIARTTPREAVTRRSDGLSPLMWALYNGQRDIADELLARLPEDSLTIHEAAATGRVGRLGVILGESPDAVNAWSPEAVNVCG